MRNKKNETVRPGFKNKIQVKSQTQVWVIPNVLPNLRRS